MDFRTIQEQYQRDRIIMWIVLILFVGLYMFKYIFWCFLPVDYANTYAHRCIGFADTIYKKIKC